MYNPLEKYIYRSNPEWREQRQLNYCCKCFVASFAFFLFCAVYVWDLSGLMLAQGEMRRDLCWTSNEPLKCVDPTYIPHYNEGAKLPVDNHLAKAMEL